MTPTEQAHKLKMIRDIASLGELEGWDRQAKLRGYFDGEKHALDVRRRELE